ncbi:LV223 protein, partial [Polyodon spathula]|nr:LV223 protein [Polyodon spathula]
MTRGDSISPQQTAKSGTEGESVTLSCSYTADSQNIYLYWYRQNSNRALEFILYKEVSSSSTYSHTADFAKSRFISRADSSSTTITISKLALSDTAIYHCALRLSQYGCIQSTCHDRIVLLSLSVLILGNTIQSEHSEVSSKEGSSITLKCTYSTSDTGSYLYWYRQFPNRAPQYMVRRGAVTLRTVKTESGLFTEKHSTNADKESTNLTLSRLEAGDAATYHCALQPHSCLSVRSTSTTGWNNSRMINMCGSFLLLVFSLGAHIEDQVTQRPDSQRVSEGESVQIHCQHQTSSFNTIEWYKRDLNQGLKYINKASRDGSTYGDDSGKYKPAVDTSSKTGSLTIQPSVSDSVIYHCAIEPAQ